jgi:hypothetical protein
MVCLLYGRSAAKLEQNLPHGLGQRTVDRATAGAFVASAAETLGYVATSSLPLLRKLTR